MMDGLKPCPFCGGEALLFGSYKHGYFVECHDCLAKTSNYGSEGMAESIAAWNTRAEQTCEMVKLADYSEYVAYRSGIYVCSRCGKKSVHESSWGYCPRCGAKVVDE